MSESQIREHFNEPQIKTLKRMNRLLASSGYIDVKVRQNAQDHWFEADWLKYLVPELLRELDGGASRVSEFEWGVVLIWLSGFAGGLTLGMFLWPTVFCKKH